MTSGVFNRVIKIDLSAFSDLLF